MEIGSRVQFVRNNGRGGEFGLKGDTGTVVDYAVSGHLEVRLDRSGQRWFASRSALRRLPAKSTKRPSIASEVSLKPFTKTVLLHLRKRGSITPLESLAAYGSARIAPQVHELRKAGYPVETQKGKDGGGHRYTRYVLAKAN